MFLSKNNRQRFDKTNTDKTIKRQTDKDKSIMSVYFHAQTQIKLRQPKRQIMTEYHYQHQHPQPQHDQQNQCNLFNLSSTNFKEKQIFNLSCNLAGIKFERQPYVLKDIPGNMILM